MNECIKTKPIVIRKLLRPKAPQMQQCKLIMRNGILVAVAAAYESLTIMSITEMWMWINRKIASYITIRKTMLILLNQEIIYSGKKTIHQDCKNWYYHQKKKKDWDKAYKSNARTLWWIDKIHWMKAKEIQITCWRGNKSYLKKLIHF